MDRYIDWKNAGSRVRSVVRRIAGRKGGESEPENIQNRVAYPVRLTRDEYEKFTRGVNDSSFPRSHMEREFAEKGIVLRHFGVVPVSIDDGETQYMVVDPNPDNVGVMVVDRAAIENICRRNGCMTINDGDAAYCNECGAEKKEWAA